ncbi:MAG: hypothetical protein ACREK5_03990 [Gemmatimonadota bacterium]
MHLDAAGNFTFSPKGSRYYIFAAAWTYDPESLAHELTRLRFRLLKKGKDLQGFHAAPDKQRIRDLEPKERMIADGNWRFAGLLVEKPKVNPSVREPEILPEVRR